MIVYPATDFFNGQGAILEQYNLNPVEGAEGHVEDHKAVAALIAETPITQLEKPFAVFIKDMGGWIGHSDFRSFLPGANDDMEPFTFSQIKSIAGSAGLRAIGAGEGADGVTDHESDTFEDGAQIFVFPVGVLGLARFASHAASLLGDLCQRLDIVDQRLAALEVG